MNRNARICFKCKKPIKGHPKPTGARCEFGTLESSFDTIADVFDIPHRVRPDKESYFDVEKRQMLVCACCGRLSTGISSEEIHLY